MEPTKVLVVEDDDEFAQLITFNLARQGCQFIRATNGVEALRLARVQTPQVILLDILMPDLDGVAVCHILQSQPATRDIPVIMLSALSRAWAEARKSRFVAYFQKPVNFAALMEAVQSAAEAKAQPPSRETRSLQPRK
jgi:CheY-like chemotaxis protein